MYVARLGKLFGYTPSQDSPSHVVRVSLEDIRDKTTWLSEGIVYKLLGVKRHGSCSSPVQLSSVSQMGGVAGCL
jgi:hypothetical protein